MDREQKSPSAVQHAFSRGTEKMSESSLSVAERRQKYGDAHAAVVPEQRERVASDAEGYKEFLGLVSNCPLEHVHAR